MAQHPFLSLAHAGHVPLLLSHGVIGSTNTSPVSPASPAQPVTTPPMCLSWFPAPGVTATAAASGRGEQRHLFLPPSDPVARSPGPEAAPALPAPSRAHRDRAILLVTKVFCSPCGRWAGSPHLQMGPSCGGGELGAAALRQLGLGQAGCRRLGVFQRRRSSASCREPPCAPSPQWHSAAPRPGSWVPAQAGVAPCQKGRRVAGSQVPRGCQGRPGTAA